MSQQLDRAELVAERRVTTCVRRPPSAVSILRDCRVGLAAAAASMADNRDRGQDTDARHTGLTTDGGGGHSLVVENLLRGWLRAAPSY